MPIDHAAVHRAWVERMLREDPLPSIDRRLLYMGLILKLEERTYHPEFDIHEAYSGQFALKPYVQFRVQLLWGPHAQVVRRRDAARDYRRRVLYWIDAIDGMIGHIYPLSTYEYEYYLERKLELERLTFD